MVTEECFMEALVIIAFQKLFNYNGRFNIPAFEISLERTICICAISALDKKLYQDEYPYTLFCYMVAL